MAIATMAGIAAGGVESMRFASVRIVPVASKDHPLAAAGSRLAPGLLRSHAQIVLSDSASSQDTPSLNVLEGGLRWYVSDVAAKRDVILSGMGWGGLPEHVVQDELQSGNLAQLDVPEFSAEAMELFVHRRRDRAHGMVAQALWEALAAAAASRAGQPVAGKAEK